MGITTEEYYAALQAALKPSEAGEGWKTAGEMAQIWKVSLRKAREILGEFDNRGELQASYIYRKGIDGKSSRRPIYLIVPTKQAN